MASSIFGPQKPSQTSFGGAPLQPSIVDRVQAFINSIGGNPDVALQMLMKSNPTFAKFVQKNQGLSPEQILKKYGK